MKKILIVVAHPDDEILGMGGTAAKLAASGAEVSLLIVTDGSTSQYKDSPDLPGIIAEKKKETENAAREVGIGKIIYGGLPDMKLDVTPHTKVNAVIESAVDEIGPDAVYTHFYGDVNLDHQCVYRSVLVAIRPVSGQTVRELYCFSVPSSTEWSPALPMTAFMPNTFVDISEYAEKKYRALAAYTEELRDYPHPRSVRYIKETDVATGLTVGIGAAESFVLLRKLS